MSNLIATNAATPVLSKNKVVVKKKKCTLNVVFGVNQYIVQQIKNVNKELQLSAAKTPFVLIIPTPQTTASSLNFSILTKLVHKGTTLNLKNFSTDVSLKTKTSWFFSKFKYSGKGLKVKKELVTTQILFNLGKSHMSKIVYDPAYIEVKRTKKNSYVMYSYLQHNQLSRFITKKIKQFNKYTRRGLRMHKQSIIRRFGKVSQVSSKKK